MTIRMVFVMIVSLYITRIALKYLGVEDYGVFNVVGGFVAMFGFLNNSLTSASQRYYNYELGKNGSKGVTDVFNTSFIIHLILAVVVLILVEIAGIWYINTKMVIPSTRLFSAKVIFQTSVLGLVFSILTTPFSAALMAYEHMNCYAMISIFDICLKLVLLLFIPYLSGDRLQLYGLSILLVTFIDFFLYVLFSKKYIAELKFEKTSRPELFKSILGFSGWRLLDSSSYMLREQGMNLVLNAFFGPIVNAARSISYQVNSAMQSFLNSVITPIRPQLTQAYAEGNISRSINLTTFTCKFSFICLYIISIPVIIETDYILGIWLGDSMPNHAVSFVRLLLITNIFGVFVFPICSLVQANGNLKFYEVISSISNFLTIPAAIVCLLACHEPEIIFLPLLLSTFLNTIAGFIAVKRLMDFPVRTFLAVTVSSGLKVVLCSLPLLLMPLLFIKQGMGRLCITLFLTLVSTSLLTYFLALDSSEKQLVKSLIFAIRNKFLHRKTL